MDDEVEKQPQSFDVRWVAIAAAPNDHSGHPPYRTRLGTPDDAEGTQHESLDQLRAAESLEYERRGFKVDYVSRDTLPQTQQAPGELARNIAEVRNPTKRQVTMVVDNLAEVSRIRNEIKSHPEHYESLLKSARKSVDGSEEFDRITSKPQTMPFPVPTP